MNKKLSTTCIIRRLTEQGTTAFDTAEFGRLLSLPANRAHQTLHRLVAAGALRRLGRGRYVLAEAGRGEALAQPFFLATRLVEPSYVSFWSALHFYGWTEQAPRVVSVANTRRTGRGRVDVYEARFVKLAPRRFFGYAAARQGGVEFPVAEPEKALVDALYLPGVAGGMETAAAALAEALPDVDRVRLEAYAAAMGVRSLCSRLGHLLGGHGVEAAGLRRRASTVYVKLDPAGPRRGRFDSTWRVIDNLGGA